MTTLIKRRGLWIVIVGVLAAFFVLTLRTFLVGGLAIGDPLPHIELVTLDGSTASVNDWRGKGLVLRLSSVNCTTCADDFELMDRWQEALGDSAQIVAVQVGDTAANVRARPSAQRATVPILLDPPGDVAAQFGIKFVPAIIFVTSRGTLSSVVNSEMALTDMRSHLELMLAGGPDINTALKRVSLQLRCQECEGRSIWESDAPSSIGMRERVYQMLLAGSREDEIVDFFASEYGPWILMAPPATGFTALAWILPAAVLSGGALAWVRIIGRTRKNMDKGSQQATEIQDHDDLVKRIDESLG